MIKQSREGCHCAVVFNNQRRAVGAHAWGPVRQLKSVKPLPIVISLILPFFQKNKQTQKQSFCNRFYILHPRFRALQ